MGRSPCCAKEGLNRGAWTAMEDKILTDYIKAHGEGKWRNLPKRAGLMRCGKSCRLRWLNYLRPDIKRGNISDDEEELIIRLHKLLGNRWSLIAGRLPGRTDNEIKNYWNTNLSKRVAAAPAADDKINKKKKKAQKNTNTNRNNITKTILLRPLSSTTSPKRTLPPSQANYSPNVVRTKAVRCTKLFLVDSQPQPPLQPQQHHSSSLLLSPHPTTPPPVAAPPSLLLQTEATPGDNIITTTTTVPSTTPPPNDDFLSASVAVPSSSSSPPFAYDSSGGGDHYWGSATNGSSSTDLTSTTFIDDTTTTTGVPTMTIDLGLDFNFLDLLDSDNTYLSDICSFDFDDSTQHHHHHHLTTTGSPMTTTSSEGEEGVEEEEKPIVFSEELMEDWRRSDCAAAALCYDGMIL